MGTDIDSDTKSWNVILPQHQYKLRVALKVPSSQGFSEQQLIHNDIIFISLMMLAPNKRHTNKSQR